METTAPEALRAARLEQQATLRDWASRLRISVGHLSRLERGLVPNVGVDLAVRVRNLAGIPIEAWVEEE